MRLARIAFTVGKPTQISRRGCCAANRMAPGGNLGLVDRGNGLRLAPHLVHRPVELRGVDGRQIDHGDRDLELVVDHFGAQRIDEATNRRFAATIDRLEWHRAVGQGRTDADDGAAIALPHPFERRHHAMHLTEIGYRGAALDLFSGQLRDRREDGRHRDIDPDLDRPELGLDVARRCLDSLGIGHVRRDRHRAHAIFRVKLVRSLVEAIRVPRQQRDVVAGLGEFLGRRPPDTRAPRP